MDTHNSASGISGVYKGTKSIVIGTGTTKRRKQMEALFFAEQVNDDEIRVQPLNEAFLPVEPEELVALDEFLTKYTPEPEIFKKKTLPAIANLRKTIARAERLRSQGETYTAEYEFKNALKLDDTNARANYGLGLTYLDRGDTEQAEQVLKRLVKLESAYSQENKHQFNEFGIKLRKNNMLDQALAYYGRAMSLAPNDEHLFYNIARVLYEKKDYAKAVSFTNKALALQPDLDIAQHLLKVLKKEGGEAVQAENAPTVDEAPETPDDVFCDLPPSHPAVGGKQPTTLPGDDMENDLPFDD